MNSRRALVPLAALVLAACGGGSDEKTDAAPAATNTPPPGSEAPAATAPGTVDSAGVGTNPPTAGGALVDTAASPGPTDTVQGTATAP
jgi:hypothetical protein